MIWWPTASRCTPEHMDLTVSAARDVFESSERSMLFRPSRTGTSVVSRLIEKLYSGMQDDL